LFHEFIRVMDIVATAQHITTLLLQYCSSEILLYAGHAVRWNFRNYFI